MNCELIEDIDISPNDIAVMVDMWVDENLDECSICHYYETCGSVEDRLIAAVVNSQFINLVKVAIDWESKYK